MQKMTAGGWWFVGGTCALAALNGALLPMLAAAGAGWAATKFVGNLMEGPVNEIYSKTESDMRARVDGIKDKELRAKAERQLKKDLESLARTRAIDDAGRREAAKIAGVGVFAAPAAAVLAGVAVLATREARRRKG